MAEYVSKETLQAKLNRKKAEPANKRYTKGWNDAVLMVKSMIHCEKAADVSPVRHGRWEVDEFGHFCTVCREYAEEVENGEGQLEPLITQYCPNCGALMDLK